MGMNRVFVSNQILNCRVPHARGDEPPDQTSDLPAAHEFPTPVGMNREMIATAICNIRVPHARGDEPTGAGIIMNGLGSSPRPWG